MKIKTDAISDDELARIYELSKDEAYTINTPYASLDNFCKFGDDIDPIIDEIDEILKKVIYGFSRFSCFVDSRSCEKRIKFQYNWDYKGNQELGEIGISFIGAGYMFIDELRGFRGD